MTSSRSCTAVASDPYGGYGTHFRLHLARHRPVSVGLAVHDTGPDRRARPASRDASEWRRNFQVELLWFKREFSESPSFVEAVRRRIDEIGPVRDRSLAVVRGVKSLAGVEGLVLMSAHVPGRRLAELLFERHDAVFVLDFIKQVAQALATLHRQGASMARGLLTANRVVLASDGRFVVMEQTLGPAFASLRLATNRLRSDFGLADPAGLDPDMLESAQRHPSARRAGAVAACRPAPSNPSDYPARTRAMRGRSSRSGTSAPAALRGWLEQRAADLATARLRAP